MIPTVAKSVGLT